MTMGMTVEQRENLFSESNNNIASNIK